MSPNSRKKKAGRNGYALDADGQCDTLAQVERRTLCNYSYLISAVLVTDTPVSQMISNVGE